MIEDRLLKNFYRLELDEQFRSFGCSVEPHSQGLLINGKYIVAISKRKWRSTGRNIWYWYKTVEDLCNNYILKDSKPKTETFKLLFSAEIKSSGIEAAVNEIRTRLLSENIKLINWKIEDASNEQA